MPVVTCTFSMMSYGMQILYPSYVTHVCLHMAGGTWWVVGKHIGPWNFGPACAVCCCLCLWLAGGPGMHHMCPRYASMPPFDASCPCPGHKYPWSPVLVYQMRCALYAHLIAFLRPDPRVCWPTGRTHPGSWHSGHGSRPGEARWGMWTLVATPPCCSSGCIRS